MVGVNKFPVKLQYRRRLWDGERARFRTTVSGVQVQAIAEIETTITVPVMKGRRGGRQGKSITVLVLLVCIHSS